jgi:DinB family protein
MIRLAKWTTRVFLHEVPIELFPAIVERLRGMPPRAAALLQSLDESLRSWSRDGSWSAKQHIGHLDDLHDLDLQRLKDYLGGATILAAADMTNRTTVEADHNATPADVLLERVRMHRDALAERLECLEEADAARVAIHPRLQRPMRVIDWMYFVAEHDDHHLARAREVVREAAATTRSQGG